jgi:hypothetical protein
MDVIKALRIDAHTVVPVVARILVIAVALRAGTIVPAASVAEEAIPAKQRAVQPDGAREKGFSVIEDVTLDSAGTLHGLVLEAGGRPLAGVEVRIVRSGSRMTSVPSDVVRSDSDGRIRWKHLRGGVYCVMTGGNQRWLRAWSAGTAPPAARQWITIEDRPQVVRGQLGESVRVSSQTMLFGAVLATGAAVPLILDGRRDDDPAGS